MSLRLKDTDGVLSVQGAVFTDREDLARFIERFADSAERWGPAQSPRSIVHRREHQLHPKGSLTVQTSTGDLREIARMLRELP